MIIKNGSTKKNDAVRIWVTLFAILLMNLFVFSTFCQSIYDLYTFNVFLAVKFARS